MDVRLVFPLRAAKKESLFVNKYAFLFLGFMGLQTLKFTWYGF
jgi:hypothetical protein